VVTARASVEVVQASLDRIGAHLADVRNQLNVGLVPPNDVLIVEAQQSRQLLSLIEAKNIRETSSAELRRLLGLQAGTPIELVDRLERPVASLDDITAGVEAARANRAERKALQTRVEGAEARGTAAAAARLPLLAIAGGYDVARPNLRIFPLRAEWQPSWDVSVNLRWSLWDGGRVRAEIAEADAGRRAAEQRLADFDSMVEVEVRQRALDLEAVEASIAAAESGVRSAGEARRVVADRFAAGVATSTDVLDAQVALLQAELDRTRALANARLAAARLDRALGR
jgi:outer membrane protein TolC